MLCLSLFWTSTALTQTTDSTAENSKNVQEQTNGSGNEASTDLQEEIEGPSGIPEKTDDSLLGFKKKHSLVYAALGFGQSGAALPGATQSFEIGYEKAQRPDMKWGFYLEYLNGDLKENFYFPNTGYSEERTNRVTFYTVGLQARHKLLRYLDIRGGVGVSMASMEVISADTDAPAPSTAPGYKESYPMSMNAKIALQLSKHFQQYGVALEFAHQQTALGMSHNVSANSVNLLFRYFYNREAKGATKAPAPIEKKDDIETPFPP